VEWYAARGDAAKALLMAEGAKRRVLQDLLLPYRFRLTRGLTVEQQREERRLFSQRVSLAKQARHERERPAPDAAKLTQLDTQLAAARTAAVEWDRALARDHFELAFQRGDANFNSATNLEQLAQQLNGVSAMVQFVVGDAQTTVLVATLAAPTATAEATSTPALDLRSYAIDITRPQLAEQVARFNDAIERHLETTSATARELYDRLLGPAREQLANRTQLVVVPDDALWILPFQALQTAADRMLDQDATITMLPSAAAWVLRPAATPAPAPASTPAAEPGAAAVTLWAAGTISDVTPLQSTITLLPQPPIPPSPSLPPLIHEGRTGDPAEPKQASQSAAQLQSQQPVAPDSATLAAWELFEHPLRADLLVVIDRSVADERIRLDQGRFGAMGLAWALQVAGVPRVAIARRALAADERDRILQQGGLRLRASISSAPDTDELHALAAFMLIGPPEPLPTGQPQPASPQ
jgi:CHAT domain-containing protein